ncbi:aminotransferase class IV family protein [Actinocorallia lasiicapitis]
MALLDGMPATPEALAALALTNYGHFTSMRVDDGHIRGLSQHIERLVRDCRTVFAVELDREQIRAHVREAIADKPGSFVCRVTVFDPAIGLVNPAAEATPSILVTARPSGPMPAAPIRVQARPYVRDEPTVKHIGLFGQLRERRAALQTGYDDALFTDASGFISEGATWNVGFFDGTNVVWPSAEVLPGVTMRLLKQVHDATISMPVNLSDLPSMEAAFATNTTVGVRAITAIGAHAFPAEHHIFDALLKEYAEIPAEPV